MKGEFDYLSKERKILLFEEMCEYTYFCGRYNYKQVVDRFNVYILLSDF